MRSTHQFAIAGLAAAAMLAAAPAHAGKATYTMPAQVTVISGCTVSATPLVFMVLVPTNTNIDSTSSIAINCTPNMPFTIDIDTGLHNNGINRRVYNAANNAYINYDVYKDPPRSAVWGTGGTKNMALNSGSTGQLIIPVYGRLNSVKTLKAGGYTDTLTITVSF